jgi:hypothetical protein
MVASSFACSMATDIAAQPNVGFEWNCGSDRRIKREAVLAFEKLFGYIAKPTTTAPGTDVPRMVRWRPQDALLFCSANGLYWPLADASVSDSRGSFRG